MLFIKSLYGTNRAFPNSVCTSIKKSRAMGAGAAENRKKSD